MSYRITGDGKGIEVKLEVSCRTAFALMLQCIRFATIGLEGEWRVTDEMMHQPWGQVLRTLQPGSMAAIANSRRPIVRQAPAFLSGKSYNANAASTPRGGQMGLMSARPSFQ